MWYILVFLVTLEGESLLFHLDKPIFYDYYSCSRIAKVVEETGGNGTTQFIQTECAFIPESRDA